MDKRFIPEDIYKIILDNVPVPTVDVVFFNPEKDKTLLFKRNNEPLKGIYYSMGGRLAKDETLLECAMRQAEGELSLKLDPKKAVLSGVQEENNPNSAFEGISYHTPNIFFGYILDKDLSELILDEQHSEAKWFQVDDPSLHPFMKTKIKIALSKLP